MTTKELKKTIRMTKKQYRKWIKASSLVDEVFEDVLYNCKVQLNHLTKDK